VRILSWLEDDPTPIPGLARILTEIDDAGRILREVGVDAAGRVLHIAPALRGPYRYGVFDLQTVDVRSMPAQDAVPRHEFEALWAAGASEFGVRKGWTVS
jgi:hypothetical protein